MLNVYKSLAKVLTGKYPVINEDQAVLAFAIRDFFKARGFPVGTIRDYKGVKYQKQADGKWKPAGKGKKQDGEKPGKDKNSAKNSKKK